MSNPDGAYRTDLPPERTEYGRSSQIWNPEPLRPLASDNDAKDKVLLYGPKGEALIRQVPRPVGFRRP